ncbi:hypothetical protein BJ085DRAFT_35534, partial [Dimargaris cristalligena]
MSQKLLNVFWGLASEDARERQNAALVLVSSIQKFHLQASAEGESAPADTLAEGSIQTEADLNARCAADVVYAYGRLIKGLPSGRLGARQGFSLALTETLAITPYLSTKLTLDLIQKHCAPEGNATKQEVRESLFGQLFGLIAIIQAGVLNRSTTTLVDIRRVYHELSDLAHARNYLREPVAQGLLLLVSRLPGSPHAQEAAELILKPFRESRIRSLDDLALLLLLQALFPELDYAEALPSRWTDGRLLSPDTLPQLTAVLQESQAESSATGAPSSSSWRPSLPTAWDLIMAIYFPPTSSASLPALFACTTVEKLASNPWFQNRTPFERFWRETVDASYFSPTAPLQHKFWGFLLFREVLPHMTESQVHILFTAPFMKILVHALSHQSADLHKVAKLTIQAIQNFAQASPQRRFLIATQLQGNHGQRDFDRLTKTRVIDTILSKMDLEGVRSYIAYLIGVFQNPLSKDQIEPDNDQEDAAATTAQAILTRRRWANGSSMTILRNNHLPKDEALFTQILMHYLVHGFFVLPSTIPAHLSNYCSAAPSPPLTDAEAQICRNHFFAFFNVIKAQFIHSETARQAAEANAPADRPEDQANSTAASRAQAAIVKSVRENDTSVNTYVLKALEEISHLVKPKGLDLRQPLDGEAESAFKQATAMVDSLGKPRRKSTAGNRIPSFRLLFAYLTLMLLDNPTEVTDDVMEALTCFAEIDRSSKPSGMTTRRRKSKGGAALTEASNGAEPETAGAEDEERPEPLEVLLDLLISLLSKPSGDHQQVVLEIFTGFMDQLNVGSLALISEVLLAGQTAGDDEDAMDIES